MLVQIRCPKCGKLGRVPDDALEMKATCKVCHSAFSVRRHVILPGQKLPANATPRATDPEKLHGQARELIQKEKFREAAPLLEAAARLNPKSAAVHFSLGYAYSQIGAEYREDEEAIRPWAEKSMAAFLKAIDLGRRHGGLTEEQVKIARDAAAAFHRVMRRDAAQPSEEKRKQIYADFVETRDSELLLGTNLASEFQAASLTDPLGGLAAMSESLQRNAAKAEKAAVAQITCKYGISEVQVKAIYQEGKQKKWPFKGVG